MKKLYPLFFYLFSCINLPINATPIDSIFANLKVKELSLLTKNNRLDLLDYINCGQKSKVDNRYGGQTLLTVKNDHYISLSQTPVSNVEMVLLQNMAGDTIVCMISTLNRPYEESTIQFYDLQGHDCAPLFSVPLTSSLLTETHPAIDTLFIPVTVHYDKATAVFVFKPSVAHLPHEEQKKLADKLLEVRYKWESATLIKLEPSR